MAVDMKDIQNQLAHLYDMVDEAKGAPFAADRCIISRDIMLDALDEIRRMLPSEIRSAQELLSSRDEFIERANQDAKRILDQAEHDAKERVSESRIVMDARNKANEIVKAAEARVREMYRVANEYTEDALRRAEDAITAAQKEMQNSRVRFRAASQDQMKRKNEELSHPMSGSDEIDN